ncbi:uncharacterized protein UV8b_07065 [Ustilaginoidea virens]|uniref:Uncharacterized protein n=1 Tax=Ustilaginoidea virens TaxID=1159556 RepID=A0A8E5HWE1_USTVR|nr:uncharacterized protein UV8b_07065 [Ustilaginoidea virens]QUC22824.1 hypothetical protein UV8b_07065 [Ustilaginoidea virens]
MSTINIVKYYFHRLNVPRTEERMRKLVALAYQSACEQQLYPKAILIRSEVHLTTTIEGERQPDPEGLHVTFSYKTQDHLGRETHITSHAYVYDTISVELRKSSPTPEKADSTLKRSGKALKPVWPSAEKLWEAPDVGYSHLP